MHIHAIRCTLRPHPGMVEVAPSASRCPVHPRLCTPASTLFQLVYFEPTGRRVYHHREKAIETTTCYILAIFPWPFFGSGGPIRITKLRRDCFRILKLSLTPWMSGRMFSIVRFSIDSSIASDRCRATSGFPRTIITH